MDALATPFKSVPALRQMSMGELGAVAVLCIHGAALSLPNSQHPIQLIDPLNGNVFQPGLVDAGAGAVVIVQFAVVAIVVAVIAVVAGVVTRVQFGVLSVVLGEFVLLEESPTRSPRSFHGVPVATLVHIRFGVCRRRCGEMVKGLRHTGWERRGWRSAGPVEWRCAVQRRSERVQGRCRRCCRGRRLFAL